VVKAPPLERQWHPCDVWRVKTTLMVLLRDGTVAMSGKKGEPYRAPRSIHTPMGRPINGEAGVGYSLQKGFYLPPLMFTETEVQALALGAKMIRPEGSTSGCSGCCPARCRRNSVTVTNATPVTDCAAS